MYSRRRWLSLATACTLAISSPGFTLSTNDLRAAEPTPAGVPASALGTQMRSFRGADGQQHFALSMVAGEAAGEAVRTDVAVLFDTSASQVGIFRNDSLAALRAMLSAMEPGAKVEIFALDLQPVSMTDGFVTPDQAAEAGLRRLDQTVPLGATDVRLGLELAADALSQSQAPQKAIIYIGDGLSYADVLQPEEFSATVDRMVQERIAVTSYAIGPNRDVHFLAALANHTGGLIYLDSEQADAPMQGGLGLAKSLVGTVYWPTSHNLNDQFASVYPSRVPPLRSDRDSIVLGTFAGEGPFELSMTVASAAGEKELNWTVTPQDHPDFAFLPRAIEMASADGGMSLPTVGSVGLGEMAWVMNKEATTLAKLSRQALASGDEEAAGRLAQAALETDPENLEASAVQGEVEQTKPADAVVYPLLQPDPFGGPAPDNADPFGSTPDSNAEAEVAPAPKAVPGAGGGVEGAPGTTGNAPTLPGPGAAPAAPGAPAAGITPGVRVPAAPRAVSSAPGGLLSSVAEDRLAISERASADIANRLRLARDLMGSDPQLAVDDLKLALTDVERAVDVDPSVRAQLIDQITSAIIDAQARVVVVDDSRMRAEEALAAGDERLRLLAASQRQQERVQQLFERFNALMEERQFAEAENAIAIPLREQFPDLPAAESAMWWSQLAGNIDRNDRLRRAKQRNFLDAMYQVELSHIPFPDEPPIVYPPAEQWEQLTLARKQYASVDLASPGSAEAAILAALEQDTNLDFLDQPLETVMDAIEAQHGIQIELDEAGLEEAAITSDAEVTVQLQGISLRSALRLMLRDLDLAYLIRDEVLVITSRDAAELEVISRVYPVGDLVMPTSPMMLMGMSGMGGGQFGGANMNGGGMGGGMGGMGGGMGGMGGGMGGGFGGGGMGGGGFGGFMQVQDDALRLGGDAETKPLPAAPAKNAPAGAPSSKAPAAAPVATAPKRAPQVLTVRIDGGDAAQAWDNLFLSQRPDPADVRQTARHLMKTKKFDELVGMLESAIRRGQPQPWMYEAMALAMQANGSPAADLERVLMSAIDFTRSYDDAVFASSYMAKVGLEARALKTLQEASYLVPERPEAYQVGLAIADESKNDEALQWACSGLLRQSSASSSKQWQDRALRTGLAAVMRLQKSGDVSGARAFAASLNGALVRDCFIRVSWTGDADVDVLVQEPTGTICSLHQPRTRAGGALLKDAYAVSGQQPVDGYSEEYACSEAFPGMYRVYIKKIWGDVTAGKVTVDVYKYYRTPQEQHERQQISLVKGDAIVQFRLEEGRRQQEMADETLIAHATKHQEIGRAILLQHLAQAEQSRTSAEYYSAVATADAAAAGTPDYGIGSRRAAGYRPVITQIPSGINMTAMAVVSADRRYVRITSIPTIQSLGQVATFNFVTGGGTVQDGGNANGNAAANANANAAAN